ncbi:UPF0382 membrane protein [Smittium mucronatum]|uniref:UPF0382 membrane protein n=1 Tax=Smittium mucronatum TaxID=133383 RepID=A0A1R0H8X8_9FUNG|nr:UPF0382 membrane protein [Smittium mucronatum]
MSPSLILKGAVFLGATGIALGAYGAHGLGKLPGITPKQIESWDTASKYQQFSAVTMLSLCALSGNNILNIKHLKSSSVLIFAGTIMFSGSIYCLVLNKERFRSLGPITPIGGLSMIVGWLALLF